MPWLFFLKNPGKIFCINIQQLRPARTKLLNVDTKNLPGLKRRALSQSLPALPFRTLRTLADSRKKDAKYHGSNLNYKLDKKKPMVFVCGRRSTLGRMLLFCVAGAGLWKYDGRVAWPCHATHMQHTVNTTRNTSTFPVNSQ